MKGTIFILGGDGFCGWPTALHLSKFGYDILILDNFSRRKIDVDLECDSLTPISGMGTRLRTWKSLTGHAIKFVHIDIATQYNKLLGLIKTHKPQAIVHFAEQRSAPFSMKSDFHKRYTVNNNANATHNVLCAIVESELDIHLAHLGTMGVYGYGTVNMPIPEGYLPVKVECEDGLRDLEILYPASPGSIYHMSKVNDAVMFYFYNKNDGVRITDLHQGIVWGTNTDNTLLDERLINRFDYDGDYGTVLNRFLVEAVVGHPLTVHGSGGQTRAFIHIKDTVQCIRLALENPPAAGEKVQIFNQATETHMVRDLAGMVAEKTGCEVRYYRNPRKEDDENTLCVDNRKFLSLGLKPITLNDGLLTEVMDVAQRYIHRCDKEKIICTSVWSKNIVKDFDGSAKPV